VTLVFVICNCELTLFTVCIMMLASNGFLFLCCEVLGRWYFVGISEPHFNEEGAVVLRRKLNTIIGKKFANNFLSVMSLA